MGAKKGEGEIIKIQKVIYMTKINKIKKRYINGKIAAMFLAVLMICFSSPVSAEWFDQTFEITHYDIGIDEDDFTGNFVTANGIPGTYRDDFLYSARGVCMQGTGLTRNDEYIHYVSGGGGWVNQDGEPTAPIHGTTDWTNGRPHWIRYPDQVTFAQGAGGACGPVTPGTSVAADLSVLPCSSMIFIGGGGIGFRRVDDAGGAITGHHIDVLVPPAITDGNYRVYVFDTEPPNGVTNLQSPSHSNAIGQWNDPQSKNNRVTVTWTNATDNIQAGLPADDVANGLDGYSIVWDHSPNTLPDETKDIEDVQSTTSPPLSNGNDWYFHIRSVDNGIDVNEDDIIDDEANWDDTAVHLGPFYIESVTVNIISPPSTSPASAGAFDNPNHVDVTVEVKIGTTPVTGLTNPDFTFKIGGKTATASLTDTSIPGTYKFDVTPPTQVAAGKYDLEVTLAYSGISTTDTEQDAVEYTSGNVDVMLIIDRSGSMRGEIGDARNAAKLFIDYMRDSDKAGVVSFSSSPRYDYHLTTLTDAIKSSIKSTISGIYAGGMTAMGDGLRYGYNDLVSRGDSAHPWAMVLLSDGYHNWGSEHPNSVLPDIRNANIKVFTIGLGPYVDANLLRNIAENSGAGGGKYYYAASSSDLKEIYDLIVGMVTGQQTSYSTTGTILPAQTSSLTVPITSSTTSATFSISWGGSDLDLVLYKPDGIEINPGVAAADPNIDYVEESTYEFYRVANPDAGEWIMEITAISVPTGGEDYTAKVRVASTLTISLTTDKDQYNQGETVKAAVSLTEDGSPLTGATVGADITLPDASTESLTLYDDGGHGDTAANDGVYANYFANTLQTGDYTVDVSATGTTPTGEQFSREDQSTFKVVAGPSLITLTPDTWIDTANAGGQIQSTFTVNDPAKIGELFPLDESTYAEYNGTHYFVYNESSIGGEPDYIIPAPPSSESLADVSTVGSATSVSTKQLSSSPVPKWVSLTATSLQTPTGDIIDVSNIIISPSVLEVPLGGSEDFDVTINIPSDAPAGTYTGKIVATAITGSDSIDVEITVISNHPPVAADDTVSTDEDTPVTIDVAANDIDEDGNLDPTTATVISDPSDGIVVNNDDGTFTYTPNENFFGTDSFTYEIYDTDGACDNARVTINVNPVNDPPVVSVDVIEQTVQYSDGITGITISATDIDSDSLTLSTTWAKDEGTVQPNLPDGLNLEVEGCDPESTPVTCTWILEGQALVDAGTYEIMFTVSDGVDENEASVTLVVEPEDASCALNDDNPVAVQVAGGNGGAFSLIVDVTEALPDSSDVLPAYPGDISLAGVPMSLLPVGPGSPVEPTSCLQTESGTGYDTTVRLTCEFEDVEVNTYEVLVAVSGGYYAGSCEDVLVVYDPSLGFTTGGGTFLWPGTGEKTNFGFTMKYNKKGKKIQGNLLLVRHLQDGTIYRVKSNALYGLALGELEDNGETYGWASFSGKATYLEPGWPEPIGNHEFIAYVEDRNEPGNGIDRFWIKVKDQDRIAIDVLSMGDPAENNAVELSGGNMVVPHKASGN